MKVRDSGMPGQDMWETFFDPLDIFDNLGLVDPAGIIVDLGSGYGTFTLPAAQIFKKSQIVGIDIEPDLNHDVIARAQAAGINNLTTRTCDFVRDGTGMDSDSTDMVLLFNILHADNPVALLKEAFRILKPGAVTAIIHWNYDPSTPRGPRMEIRPKPDQVLAWAAQAGFAVPASAIPVACFHYGFLATKLDS